MKHVMPRTITVENALGASTGCRFHAPHHSQTPAVDDIEGGPESQLNF